MNASTCGNLRQCRVRFAAFDSLQWEDKAADGTLPAADGLQIPSERDANFFAWTQYGQLSPEYQ
jgi:hypothetical protein